MGLHWKISALLLTLSFTKAFGNPIDVIAPDDVSSRTAEDPYRLETTVLPSRYELTLTVEDDFGPKGVFTGSLKIHVYPNAPVSEITLHAYALQIDESKIELECEGVNMFSSLTTQSAYHLITVHSTQEIPSGAHCHLTFTDFVGVLSDNMQGFYRSSYTNANGETEWLATTQMEPTHTRKAFPCFDEPSFKATFQVTIYHPSDYTSISNTPLLSSTTNETSGVTVDVFQETPIMSTYLVAFVVSKFAYLEDSARKQRVYAREEALSTALYTFSVTPPLVETLENLTGIEYLSTGIGKLAQIAIPDFSAGAMENWGLITYRERNLLWEPGHSSNSYKQAIAAVIAHELTHMWFGNLVTCEWWSYTWLNEGFARYFQYFATAEVETSWEMERQFVVAQQQVVFALDALASTEAMTSNASSPSEVSVKFSSISYNKGASVIRMTKHFMGEQNWKQGIQDYLQARKFSPSVPQYLFDAWSNYATNLPSGKTFTDVMTIWTENAGFPVLTVTVSGMDAVITQKRFFLNASETSNTKWDIPITYTTSEYRDFQNTTPTLWFPSTANNISISHAIHNPDDWIILNVQETGYYRVNYDDTLWSSIEAALKSDNFGGIHVLNRAQIVDDAINLARADEITYSRALDILSYLSKETEYYPWYSAFQGLSYLYRRIGQNETIGPLFQDFVTRLLVNVTASVPFNHNDDNNQIYTFNKIQILSWSCRFEVEDCVQNSLAALREYQYNGISVNANMRGLVYCNGLRYANSSDSWYFLYKKYLDSKLSTEEVTIIDALGCTENTTLLHEYLSKIISDEQQFRAQDISTVFSAVYSRPTGVSVLYEFLKTHHSVLPNYYSSWASLFSNVAERFTTQEEISDLEEFLRQNSNELGSAVSAIQNAIDTAKVNIAWTNELSSKLLTYFAAQPDAASLPTVSVAMTMVSAMIALFILR